VRGKTCRRWPSRIEAAVRVRSQSKWAEYLLRSKCDIFLRRPDTAVRKLRLGRIQKRRTPSNAHPERIPDSGVRSETPETISVFVPHPLEAPKSANSSGETANTQSSCSETTTMKATGRIRSSRGARADRYHRHLQGTGCRLRMHSMKKPPVSHRGTTPPANSSRRKSAELNRREECHRPIHLLYCDWHP